MLLNGPLRLPKRPAQLVLVDTKEAEMAPDGPTEPCRVFVMKQSGIGEACHILSGMGLFLREPDKSKGAVAQILGSFNEGREKEAL